MINCCRKTNKIERLWNRLTRKRVEWSSPDSDTLSFRCVYVSDRLWWKFTKAVWKLTIGKLLPKPNKKIHTVGNFDKFTFPQINCVPPTLLTEDIIGVQPMTGPIKKVNKE